MEIDGLSVESGSKQGGRTRVLIIEPYHIRSTAGKILLLYCNRPTCVEKYVMRDPGRKAVVWGPNLEARPAGDYRAAIAALRVREGGLASCHAARLVDPQRPRRDGRRACGT